MSSFLPTIIWRHKKENLKKCSLSGLESRSDLTFLSYPKDSLPYLENYLILKLNAPVLSQKDQNKGLFLIDATWRYAAIMEKNITEKKLPFKMETRSLPEIFQTAYPRKQTSCPDPKRGLASLEALFVAHLILKKATHGLLDHYYWKETFLKLNAKALQDFGYIQS